MWRVLHSIWWSFLLGLTVAMGQTNQIGVDFIVKDEQGNSLPCRIHLQDEQGKVFRGADLPAWKDHFVCDGQASVDLSPNGYRWEIERGPEYQRAAGELVVQEGRRSRVDVTLRRITNLREEGWYSGDLHIHRSPADVELLMKAEDLDFGPVITWWNQRSVPFGEMPVRKTFDRNRYYELIGGEDEREGGALLFFGLDRPLDIAADSREYPSPMQFVRAAQQANPDVWIDIEKPFWWDVPCWLASGQMDSIGIANNHMCRSGMLESEAWGKSRDPSRLPAPRGNGFWTQEIYYHALNAGIRIPPSAGSASGVLPNPVGYNRVYVQTEQPPDRKGWFAGLAAGSSFVTNGPLLRVTVDGKHAGSKWKVGSNGGKELKLEIRLDSNDPIRRIELIHNGTIAKVIGEDVGTHFESSLAYSFPEDGWFLVRAIADVDHTFRFASTAPWYLDSADGQIPIRKFSSQFFLDWQQQRMDRIRAAVSDSQQLSEVLVPHIQAHEFWTQRVEQANRGAQPGEERRVTSTSGLATALPVVREVDRQPLFASINRLIQAMDAVGSPLSPETALELKRWMSETDQTAAIEGVQRLLDRLCLVGIQVDSGRAPQVLPGSARRELTEQGWRTFLVKVINHAGSKGRLLVASPNSQPLPHAPAEEVDSRWMQLSVFEGQPMKANLSGLAVEYRLIQIYSRDAGEKQATLAFSVSGHPEGNNDRIEQWRFDQDHAGWFAMNQMEMEQKEGSLRVRSQGNDPYMGTKVSGPAGTYVLRFWAKTDQGGMGQFFWWTTRHPNPSGDRRANFLLEPGREHLYEIPFTAADPLQGIRLDPMSEVGEMRIDWIDLYSAERKNHWSRYQESFQCLPSSRLKFQVLDATGKPGFATFVIRDSQGRIYPAQSKRLAPDFFFHRQIYRGDGETVTLPVGDYMIECSRGPESIQETKRVRVDGTKPAVLNYQVKRWVDPSTLGWWSGDHHIHAAGCRHYENPTQGVNPDDMIRHLMGEDLKVGCCLTWGPCFDFQKRFFTGKVASQSQYPYTLRYDVEVSGFGSHQSGHLNLLNLQDQIYPGGDSKDHWPTLGLNTLRWAKRQGAVCGPAHSSIGLTKFVGRVPGTEDKEGAEDLPNYRIPTFDGIGANEFIVDVTHQVPGPEGKLVPAVDFISAMNTQRVAEWNMWYHVLNCGFRVAVSGETDFPCVSGERVGLGRVYAQVDGELTFAKWVQSIAAGRSYVSDASVHLMNFRATHVASGKRVDLGQGNSQLDLDGRQQVRFQVIAVAKQEGVESVPVELIVNGYPVAKQMLACDGKQQTLEFETDISSSSWVALRVFPHAHTNPIYVLVDGRPIRASADSARWCLAGVQQCWRSKQSTYSEDEQDQAREAYDHALARFGSILDECLEQ